jgi:hypothetical protein
VIKRASSTDDLVAADSHPHFSPWQPYQEAKRSESQVPLLFFLFSTIIIIIIEVPFPLKIICLTLSILWRTYPLTCSTFNRTTDRGGSVPERRPIDIID